MVLAPTFRASAIFRTDSPSARSSRRRSSSSRTLAGFVAEQIEDRDAARRLELGVVAGCVGFAGISVATLGSIPSPVELLADVWSNDPSIQRLPRNPAGLHLSLSPLRGGGAIGIGGAL
jgi:hypothetical protein